MDIAALGIKIDSSGAVKATDDLNRLTAAAGKAEGSTSNASKAFTEMDRATQRSAASVANLAMSVSRLGSMIGAAMSVREILRAAESWTGLQNRLRLVTESTAQLGRATDDVYKIAQRTSSSLDSTSQVYQKFAQNADALGLSMGKVAQLTDTVSKAVAISTSSAQAADAALMQFGQALGSGVLRGEEFNSIIEQAPGLMQALADGLGVPIGAMRQLAADGKLTGDVIVDALTRAADSVDQKFGTRIKTVSQATTELSNAFTRFVGQVDSSTGATATLAKAVSGLANNFDLVASVVGTLAAARLAPWLIGVGGAALSAAASVGTATGALVALRTAALALVGGPVGAIVTAIGLGATAWYAFGKAAEDSLDIASRGVLTTNDGLADMVKKFNELNAVQQALAIGERQNDLANATREASQALDDLIGKVAVVEGARAAPRIREAFSEQLRGIVDDAQLTNAQVASSLMDLVNKFTDGTRVNSEYRKSLLEQVQAYLTARTAAGEYSAQLEALKKALEDTEAGINGVTGGLGDQAAALGEFMKTYATNGEKMAAELKKWDEALGGLTGEQRQRIIDRFTVKVARTTKTLSEAAKAAKAFEDERARSLQAQYEEIAKLDEQATALEQQALYFGYSEQALNALTIARLRDQQAALAGIDGAEEQVAILERQIDAYQRMGAAMGDIATKEQQKAEWEQWSNDVGRIFDQVGQKLTDALFDGGKSGRELIQDLFKTLTLKVLVQPVMGALQGAVTQSLGGLLGIGGAQSGGVGGLLSGASNLSSLYSAVTGGIVESMASGAVAIGKTIGSSALTSFGLGMSSKSALSGMGIMGAEAMSGATAATGSAAAGGAAGAGQAFATAAPYIAGAAAVAAIAQSAFALGAKETTATGQMGWVSGRTGAGNVLSYEMAERNNGWGRSDASYVDFSAGDAGIQAVVGQAVTQTALAIKGYADTLNIGNDMLMEYSKHINIPQMGQTAEQIQATILQEVQEFGVEMAQFYWPALDDFKKTGESAADTLARLAVSIQSVNPVLETLGLRAFDFSLQGGAMAASLADMMGGLDGFGAATGAYYDAFYSEQEKFDVAAQRMAESITGMGLVMPDLSLSAEQAKAQYRALVDAQDLTTEAGQRNFAVLMQSAGVFDGLTQAAESLGIAASDAADQVMSVAEIEKQRTDLERQLDIMIGGVAKQREFELAALHESNRAIQEQIYALQDQAEAAQRAAAVASERSGLETRLLQLQGNTAELRRRELAGLDASNRAIMQRIWALEDSAAAEAAAAQAAQDRYRQELAHWQSLQDNVQTAFREVQRVAAAEIEKLRDAARQTDSAMAALTQRVSAHTSLINDQVNGLETLLGTLRGVFDYLGDQIRDLRGISGSRGMYAQQGRDFIAQALSGGGVPELDKLTEAVSAIRDEMAATEYGSAFERDYAANVLANQLDALQDQTEPQISLAEQQLKIAQDQLAELQEMVRKAQATIDETRGVKDNTAGLKVSWNAFTESLVETLDQSASFDKVIEAIDAGTSISGETWAEQLAQWGSMIDAAQQQNAALQSLVDAGLITDANSKTQIGRLGDLLTEAKKQVGSLALVDTSTADGAASARAQIASLADLMKQAKLDATLLDAIAGSSEGLLAAWDSFTASMVDVLDQSDSFAAIIAAIESGAGVTESAWLAQIGKWDASLDAAQKQYTALQSLVDAGLVTDAGTQAQIDALGALLAEAQKQVGVLEGVDTNTGSSGTAGEQIKKLSDLFESAQKQSQELTSIGDSTSFTKDLYNTALSAATYEKWATAQIDGINAQLDMAQKQVDAFNGLGGQFGTMIDALNNLAKAMKAAEVAKPTLPDTGAGQTPPKIELPETIDLDYYTERSQHEGSSGAFKRIYMPTTDKEAVAFGNTYGRQFTTEYYAYIQSNGLSNTDSRYREFMQSKWRTIDFSKEENKKKYAYAMGGNHSGGLRLVGELGPELEVTGPSRVFNHMKTQDILRNAMMGRGTMGPEMATLTRHAEQMIRTMETMGRATVQQLHRIARQLERWDTDGMPETRVLEPV